VLFHFESSSRSTEVDDWEKELFLQRWLPLTAVDPASNPHLHHGMPKLSGALAWVPRRPRLRQRLRRLARR
jgi:hypothetical protein